MMKEIEQSLMLVALIATSVAGQEGPMGEKDPASASVRFFYDTAKRNILRGAEKMPETDYAFRPTPEVRTFAQLVGHIADAQFLFCSSARNEPNPSGKNLGPGDPSDRVLERTRDTKLGAVAALREAFAYCDPVFENLTDTRWSDPVKLIGEDQRRAMPLMLTIVHLWEHYGNMVTYLRMKRIVPPSSEARPTAHGDPASRPSASLAA